MTRMVTLTPGLIAELACSVPSWSEMERLTTEILEREVGADTVFFMNQTGPTDSFRGVLAEASAELRCAWSKIGGTKAPGQLLSAALARDGVVVDSELFGTALREQEYYHSFMAPFKGYTTLFGVMASPPNASLYGAATRKAAADIGVCGEVILGRCLGSRPFTQAQCAQVASILPTLTLAHRAFHPTAATRAFTPSVPLSPREREVLSYLHLGYTNREIGIALGTKERTVRNQLSHIYEKMGVGSRAEAVGLMGLGP
jgi:DNA-binding CsgD family transcriptional regulator